MSTIVITGASTGIGRALALRWARDRARLVLSARDEAALEEVRVACERLGADAHAVAGDVTVEGAREALIEKALALGGVDVLVNNAGRGYYAPISDIDLSGLRDLFELNVVAPLALTQRALPSLRSTRGMVVMVSSVAGLVGPPRSGAYAATKFALEGLSMAMRAELQSDGVGVLVVRPGPVATPFRENAQHGAGVGYAARDPKAQTAEEVAERVLDAVAGRRAVDETSSFARLASALSRYAPPLLRVQLRRMADRPPPP